MWKNYNYIPMRNSGLPELKQISFKRIITLGEGSALIAYIKQSFEKFFVSHFVILPPSIRTVICKYVMEALAQLHAFYRSLCDLRRSTFESYTNLTPQTSFDRLSVKQP